MKKINKLLNMNVENYDDVDELFDEIQYNIKFDENDLRKKQIEYNKQFEL